MAEQMTYLEAAARRICDATCHNPDAPSQMGGAAVPWWVEYEPEARAALTAIGMTEAQQMMPVGSLAIVPEDVAKRRAEHAARVADAYDRIHRAGRPAARPGSEG